MEDNTLPTQITEEELEEKASKVEKSSETKETVINLTSKNSGCNNCPLLFTAGIFLVVAGLSYLFYQVYLNSNFFFNNKDYQQEIVYEPKYIEPEENSDKLMKDPLAQDDPENMTEDELGDELTENVDKDLELLEKELDQIDLELSEIENSNF